MPSPTYTYNIDWGTMDPVDMVSWIRSQTGDTGTFEIDVNNESEVAWLMSDQEIQSYLAVFDQPIDALTACADQCASLVSQDPVTYKAGSNDAEAQWTARVDSWRFLSFKCRGGQVKVPGSP